MKIYAWESLSLKVKNAHWNVFSNSYFDIKHVWAGYGGLRRHILIPPIILWGNIWTCNSLCIWNVVFIEKIIIMGYILLKGKISVGMSSLIPTSTSNMFDWFILPKNRHFSQKLQRSYVDKNANAQIEGNVSRKLYNFLGNFCRIFYKKCPEEHFCLWNQKEIRDI